MIHPRDASLNCVRLWRVLDDSSLGPQRLVGLRGYIHARRTLKKLIVASKNYILHLKMIWGRKSAVGTNYTLRVRYYTIIIFDNQR